MGWDPEETGVQTKFCFVLMGEITMKENDLVKRRKWTTGEGNCWRDVPLSRQGAGQVQSGCGGGIWVESRKESLQEAYSRQRERQLTAMPR